MDNDLLDDAISSFDSAIAIQPTYRAYFHLASCYHRTSRYEQAVENYQRALGIRFDSEWAYLNLGGSFGALGRFDESEKAYKRALSISHDLTDAKVRLDQLYVEQTRYHAATTILRQVERADAYTLLSTSLRKDRQIAEAHEAIATSLELAPDEVVAWDEYLAVGTALHESGNSERAETVYREYLKRRPESESAWQNLGILLFSEDRFEEALSAFDNAVSANPSSVEALLGLAQSAEKLEHPGISEKAYLRVVILDPENTVAKQKLSLLRSQRR
jgi:tetratricopeptide (TPR) repeat protein